MDDLEVLSWLTRAEARALRALARRLRPQLGAARLLRRRVGLALLPYQAEGTRFVLGEALVSEVWLRLPRHRVEGYGAVLGEDLGKAQALALLDAALAAGVGRGEILALAEGVRQGWQAARARLLRQVEATRLEVETL
ncbi:MAG: phosphonate C-P lyase system protein PhnG [Meiothermus sp.]|uniref:phosphonate C-P lyase system protein PhnG n=1 Tax=Meiothermus sp. TaxID=1955249 RepID=UPI0025FD1146|nr:phosphonate C-P lyase system protein PhnG [Meiothermus sp.]MCS7193365.1 phosphonate C-P lyase system protein PhnG [Meiothermus sp.]MDW8091774.1 phosphonate C-P lyase system protein PhnG [Meiothermus sp.]